MLSDYPKIQKMRVSGERYLENLQILSRNFFSLKVVKYDQLIFDQKFSASSDNFLNSKNEMEYYN